MKIFLLDLDPDEGAMRDAENARYLLLIIN